MGYHLGIDLGTTYSAAAVFRDGRANIVELGLRSASIPSVVFLREDETVLAGDQAHRRAASEPHRVAREFKRRLGDSTPLLLGGSPYSADALMAQLLQWIVERVVEREGGPPASIAVTHPANWGPYKIDLLQQLVRLAGLDDVLLATEPEAAVRHYAGQARVDPGSVIAVYDLGGGTFDAALLRKTADGFEPLGRPEGIERLGGIDFDAAVLGHVMRALGGAVEELDQDDPTTLQALARLRQDCVEAKEALSGDTHVLIPVMLPTIQSEVRLTRAEFESMVRPSLANSIDAMNRALSSADITADDVTTVLLVGGSSRIPMIAQLVSNEFGRSVAIDADPKHAIALGAALLTADVAVASGVPAIGESDTHASVIVGSDEVVATVALEQPAENTAVVPPVSPPIAPGAPQRDSAEPALGSNERSKTPMLVGAGLAAIAAIATGFVVLQGSGGGTPENVAAAATSVIVDSVQTTELAVSTEPSVVTTVEQPVAGPSVEAAPRTTAVKVTTTTEPTPTTTVVQPTACPLEPERTACITSISVDDDGGLVALYDTHGYEPSLSPTNSEHIHFYFDSVIGGDERNAGSAGVGGAWRLWDGPNPFTTTDGNDGRPGYTLAEAEAAGASKLCSIVAAPSHAAVVGTGNCVEIPAGG